MLFLIAWPEDRRSCTGSPSLTPSKKICAPCWALAEGRSRPPTPGTTPLMAPAMRRRPRKIPLRQLPTQRSTTTTRRLTPSPQSTTASFSALGSWFVIWKRCLLTLVVTQWKKSKILTSFWVEVTSAECHRVWLHDHDGSIFQPFFWQRDIRDQLWTALSSWFVKLAGVCEETVFCWASWSFFMLYHFCSLTHDCKQISANHFVQSFVYILESENLILLGVRLIWTFLMQGARKRKKLPTHLCGGNWVLRFSLSWFLRTIDEVANLTFQLLSCRWAKSTFILPCGWKSAQ